MCCHSYRVTCCKTGSEETVYIYLFPGRYEFTGCDSDFNASGSCDECKNKAVSLLMRELNSRSDD